MKRLHIGLLVLGFISIWSIQAILFSDEAAAQVRSNWDGGGGGSAPWWMSLIMVGVFLVALIYMWRTTLLAFGPCMIIGYIFLGPLGFVVGFFGGLLCFMFVIPMLFPNLEGEEDEKLRMTDEDFEWWACNTLKGEGYLQIKDNPESTEPKTAFIFSDGILKIAIPAKWYSSLQGEEAIKAAIAVKEAYQCDKGWVMTNVSFKHQPLVLAEANNIEIYDAGGGFDIPSCKLSEAGRDR
jgi:hypothetical protein